MKIARRPDIIINVISPLLLGYVIYLISGIVRIFSPLKNYLPDALWAYSFMSMILIIWDRQLNLYWIISSYLLVAAFELFQYLNFVPGTADIVDVIAYFVFMSIGLAVNSFFKVLHHKPLK